MTTDPSGPPAAGAAQPQRFVLDSEHVGDIRGAFGTIGQYEGGRRGLRARALVRTTRAEYQRPARVAVA